MRFPLAVAVLGLVTATSAFAQADPAALLGKMEDISLYPLLPITRSNHNYSLTGYGFEFSFKVGEWATSKRDTIVRKLSSIYSSPPRTDTTFSPSGAVVSTQHRGKHVDTTFTAAVEPLNTVHALFELAVGNQTTEIRKDDIVPGWQLTGRIREFPSLTLYTTIEPEWNISPYIGLTFTQAQLQGVRVVSSDSAATVESSGVGGGFSVGFVAEIRHVNAFIEASGTTLRLNTRGWKRPMNFPSATLPDFLELTGMRFSIGLQLHVGSEK